MNISKQVLRLVTVLMAAGWLSLAHASSDDDELCEPFRDGKVDTTLLGTMLDAARDGNLYRIQKDTSKVGFCASSELGEVKGEFRDFSGGLALTPEDNRTNTGQAMVIINVASLDTRGSVIESLLKGKRFFDVKQYPDILFVSRGFEWTGDNSARIIGELTVHGVTRPVVFGVTLTPLEGSADDAVERMQVKATTTIHRSEFDMDSLSQLVSDSVDLCLSVEVMRYTS